MKKTILFFAVASLVAVTSCKKKGCTDPTAINYDSEAEKDDGSCVDAPDETTVTVASNITSNTTWTADKVYVLASRVAVEAGAELTIEAGTIIKGQAGTGANATALLVARGGKLFANGTPLDWAQKANKEKAISLLKKNGAKTAKELQTK